MGEAQQLRSGTGVRVRGRGLAVVPEISAKCEAEPSMRVRTSSSTYFAQIESALSIPNTAARLERLAAST